MSRRPVQQRRPAAATASLTTPPATSLPLSRSPRRRSARAHRGPPVQLRIAVFLLLAAVAAGGAAALLWPRANASGPETAAAHTIQVSMSGFSESVVTARAGQPLRLRLVNPDSSFHTDGGGWHQLAIPALGVDARVAPRGVSLVDIPAAPPGDYPFYCDICCGGKENPAMQGTLRVVA